MGAPTSDTALIMVYFFPWLIMLIHRLGNLLGLPSTNQTWQWTVPQLYRCFFLKCQFSSGISPAMFDYQVEVLHLLMASLGTQQQVTQKFTTSYPGPTARMTATLVAPWCAR